MIQIYHFWANITNRLHRIDQFIPRLIVRLTLVVSRFCIPVPLVPIWSSMVTDCQ